MALPSFTYSGVSYAGQPAGTTTFALTTSSGKAIGYLLPSHIHVYSSTDNGATLVELLRPSQWGFNAAGTSVVLTTGIAAGTGIVIQRITSSDGPYTTFGQGTLLTADQLNESTLFNLYVSQETDDQSLAAAAVASTATSTATAATTAANTALSTANTALSASNTALSQSASALSASASAVTTANASNATATTANTNSVNSVNTSNTALSTANAASSTANTALSTANTADTKADAAIAAVASSVNYVAIANVAAIPAFPGNNTYIEVIDSTGLQSFTPLLGMPAGFVGDAGLSVRLRYTTSPATWNWLNYYANNADARYLKLAGGTLTGPLTLAGAPSSSLQPTTKGYVDSATATLTAAADAAQTTATAALPKAGGVMSGPITFAVSQVFPTASTTTSGIVQLSDSTNSTSSSTAGTSAAIKAVQDFALVISTTANAALPRAGGTISGNIDNSSTGYFDLPSGTTAQRPGSPNSGMIRFNTDLLQFEGHTGSAWSAVGGGATGGGADRWAVEHDNTITQSYTIGTGKNVISAGPITIQSGAVVTVPSTSAWSIV